MEIAYKAGRCYQRNSVTGRNCADCAEPLPQHAGRGRPRVRCEECGARYRAVYLQDYKKEWGEHRRTVAKFGRLHRAKGGSLAEIARYRNFLRHLMMEAEMADLHERLAGRGA